MPKPGLHVLVHLQEVLADVTSGSFLAIGPDIYRFIVILRVEPRVDLKEPLQDGILNGLVNQDDELEVLRQQFLPLLNEISVLVVEEPLWRKIWEVLCGSKLQILQQPLVHLVKVRVPPPEDPDLR